MRIRVRAPGVSRTSLRTLSTTDSSSPASSATRACSDCSKSSSPRIAAAVTSATWSSQPGVRGEELDHLVLDEGGVHVHDDQPLRPPVQPRRDHGDVHAERRRLGASAVRSGSVSTPDTANSTAVTGYLASRKIRSMLPPVAVIRAAIAAVDSAVSGCPSTVTWERPIAARAGCRRGRR